MMVLIVLIVDNHCSLGVMLESCESRARTRDMKLERRDKRVETECF